jgi:23S rRNA A2030 N6-methylase RlmJ
MYIELHCNCSADFMKHTTIAYILHNKFNSVVAKALTYYYFDTDMHAGHIGPYCLFHICYIRSLIR